MQVRWRGSSQHHRVLLAPPEVDQLVLADRALGSPETTPRHLSPPPPQLFPSPHHLHLHHHLYRRRQIVRNMVTAVDGDARKVQVVCSSINCILHLLRVIVIIIFFDPTSTKPQAEKLG